MRTSIVFLAFLSLASLHVANGGPNELKDCATEFGKKIKGFLTKLLTGGDMSNAKQEICPHMEVFTKCAMKASYDKRPSDSELADLKKSLTTSNQNINKIDCGIDMAKVADQVWNAAGIAHPLSLVATTLAAFTAMLASKGL